MSDKGKRNTLIVPLFIPNQGCPHRCIFCHQERITAQPAKAIGPSGIRDILDTALKSSRFKRAEKREIAFYGGTFMGLPRSRMTAYLQAVEPYVKADLFQSIRLSTRPDTVDHERLALLSRFPVSTVELGAQSMDDRVLTLSKRGHRAEDTVKAVRLLKGEGFRVGVQLMPGLPGDSEEIFRRTIDRVIALRPDMARLYPAIVIRGTEMAEMYLKKTYRPLNLEQAVGICMESCRRLEDHGISVIRIGLMSSPTLLEEGQILAGPWHSAFGFLVRSGIHQKRIEACLPEPSPAGRIRLRVPGREIPLVRGYRNQGLRAIEGKTGAKVVGVVADESVTPGEVGVDIL